MNAINAPASVYVDGQWLDAQWMVEVMDDDSGELVITATVAGPAKASRRREFDEDYYEDDAAVDHAN